MRGRKKITVWLIATVLAALCPAFVSGEAPENTTAGAISAPEAPNAPEEEGKQTGEDGPATDKPADFPETVPEASRPNAEDPPPPEEDGPLRETSEESETPDEERAEERDDETIDEGVETENAVSDADEKAVLNVVLPSDLDFFIDPYELTGRGQVYSEAQTIENRGDNDVFLIFSDITVTLANGTEAVAAPFDAYAGSARKAVYLRLDFGRSDLPPLVLTDEAARAQGARIPLRAAGNEGSSCAFNLAGNVNYGPGADWRDGDAKVSLRYYMETIPPPAEPEGPEEAVGEQAKPEEDTGEQAADIASEQNEGGS